MSDHECHSLDCFHTSPHSCHEANCNKNQVASLQARLEQCEGEKVALAHDRDNWLYRCHSVEDERTELRAERDAALERVREVEAAKEAVYSTLVDERKRLATLEAAVKEAGDAWQVQTNVREGITFRLKMKALLALRAGMR